MSRFKETLTAIINDWDLYLVFFGLVVLALFTLHPSETPDIIASVLFIVGITLATLLAYSYVKILEGKPVGAIQIDADLGTAMKIALAFTVYRQLTSAESPGLLIIYFVGIPVMTLFVYLPLKIYRSHQEAKKQTGK